MNRLFALGLVLCLASTSLLADTQKPSTVNNVRALAIDSSSVRVSWNKPWDDVGVLGYNIYRNGVYYVTVFSTQYIDTNLSSGQTYDYGIVAFDAAKNFNTVSATSSVTLAAANAPSTQAPPPATDPSAPPAAPTALRAEVQNGNAAKLFWQASASDNIKGYNIYRDNNYIAFVTQNEFLSEGLVWNQDYHFQIVAATHNGLYSAKSEEVVVNTAANNAAEQSTTAVIQNDESVLRAASNGNAPDGYSLVFSDEFNDFSLDTSKWNSNYRWGANWTINGEQQYYVDRINNPDFGHSPFEFDGNHLTITAIRTPDHLKSSANNKPYLSGALTTFNKFKMRYGYVEMRAKLPKGKGLWSALWLLHQNDNDRRPEIDIVEYIGDKPTVAYNTYHYYDNWSLRSSPSYEAWGPDYSQDFHTYAVKWEPGKLSWYVDGELRNTHNDGNVSWEDMYLLVNLAVGGWWPGDPDGSTPFPARYQIDYIRAYEKN